MKLLRALLMLALLGSVAVANARAASGADGPAAVVQALYHSAYVHFGFDPDAVKAARPWLTPELCSRLWKKVSQPVAKGDAPDIEADVFLNAQELPDKFVVGKASIGEAKAKVGVTLNWGGASGEKRRYTVLLQQIEGSWKVYDVDYGQDGKLTDLLK